MNFGPGFLKAIKMLYSNPKTQLFVNGIRSDDFTLSQGTHQGCPLSPLLFVISLEPLAVAIRHDVNIKGIRIAEREHKLNLFADDMVLFVSQPLS